MNLQALSMSAALLMTLTLAAPAHADPPQRDQHKHKVVVAHPRGHTLKALPKGHSTIHVRGKAYRYHAGVFYRPHPSQGFIVVAAPIGAVVASLPVGHVVVHTGGRPYHVYNGAYYVWQDDHYVVVEEPSEATETSGVVAYPRDGQDAETQARDRYECHAWAMGESDFDPGQGLSGSDKQRTTYERAIKACLEGRGYTVQ